MKSAILLTAYKDFDVLLVLLDYYSKHYSCYVHVDKRSTIPDDFLKAVEQMKNVQIIQKYRIHWGSYKHVKAFVELLKRACQDGCEYFHLIPADTFPVKNIKVSNDFFEKNSDRNFIEMFPIKEERNMEQRQALFYFQHLYDLKTDRGYTCERRLLKLQRMLGISRKIRMKYKGYVYCHLSLTFVKYLLDYLKKNPGYFYLMSTYSIAEEFFFQNIISETKFEAVNTHLIYDIWEENKGGPEILSREQIEEALNSKCMFARKIADIDSAEMVLKRVCCTQEEMI